MIIRCFNYSLYSIILFICSTLHAQNQNWNDHFSYQQVIDVSTTNNQVIVATTNGLFIYDYQNSDIKKLSKVNGLNDVGIAAFGNIKEDLLAIGYTSGAIDLVNPDSVFNIIDIPLDDYQGNKTINHFTAVDNQLVISTNYGISIYNIEEREFGLTTFFRVNSEYTNVNESAIVDNIVYSATNDGLYYHPLDNFISNYLFWNELSNLSFSQITNFNNELIVSSNGSLYRKSGDALVQIRSFDNIIDLKSNNGFLIVTTSNSVYVLDSDFNTIQQQDFEEFLVSGSTFNNVIIAGSQSDGLIINNDKIYPDGPYSNSSYNVTVQENQIWVSPGGKQNFNQPVYNKEGYFHFNSKEWIHVKSETLNNSLDIVDITVDPTDSTHIFASTWNQDSGLMEIRSNQLIKEYTDQNSALPSLLRIGGTAYDEENNLWVAQSFVGSTATNSLSKLNNGNFTVYNLEAYDNAPSSAGTESPVIDNQGFVWLIGSRGDGLVTTNGTEFYTINNSSSEAEDLPSLNVRALAFDNQGTAWIGTSEGLRIFNNPIENLRNGNSSLNVVVITQNGLPEALLNETSILDIVVDGANQKWIATAGGGVYQVSEYGDEILNEFNKNNSPLPSNTVFAIDIDESTGMVYFATSKGLVSYNSNVTSSGDSFGEIIAFPNPVRPGFTGKITIKGLSSKAKVRILDINGNLIFRQQVKGGVLTWDGTNFQGKPVATGVYLVLMTSADGMKKASTKIAIIR